jgi:hypothetical protein
MCSVVPYISLTDEHFFRIFKGFLGFSEVDDQFTNIRVEDIIFGDNAFLGVEIILRMAEMIAPPFLIDIVASMCRLESAWPAAISRIAVLPNGKDFRQFE